MAKIFITGSSAGLGLLAGRTLISMGHEVVLHARNGEKAAQTLHEAKGAADVLTADLSSIEETKRLAEEVDSFGVFDAVVHNAGLYRDSAERVFAVNTLAPYILTSLIRRPGRLIYLSSGMHMSGSAKLEAFGGDVRRINYSDTKLHVLMLCKAVARLWPGVYANTVNPGWVPTRMGGAGAPDDLQKGYETQVWLATSDDAGAQVSGRYFFHQKGQRYNTEADDTETQDRFIAQCESVTGLRLPR